MCQSMAAFQGQLLYLSSEKPIWKELNKLQFVGFALFSSLSFVCSSEFLFALYITNLPCNTGKQLIKRIVDTHEHISNYLRYLLKTISHTEVST
ncbi:hypothetical protein PRUPE_5G139800 [Prunus persica]|uniref:Uncharacterized protein n=1 Tax=Prunus persica TaxID=3760 RepID=M5WCH8_PRUPE|nr:hypothetical protein PRUPE_5G139800 [Prunus persica]